MTQRPNIVLIHSDQHRYDAIGANGNDVVQTPNLDRLAADGATFPHAFTTCPICTPARASLMTGAWATTHKSLCIPSSDFWQPARRELPVLPELMRDGGYYQGMVGRYHQELEGTPTDHGVEDFIPTEAYGKWIKENDIPELSWEGGLFGAVNRTVPDEQSPLAFQSDRVMELLGKGAELSRPFFIRWDPVEPHLPYRPSATFHSMYDGIAIPPWPSFPDSLEGKPAPQRRLHLIWGTGGWSWEDWEPYVRLYYAQVTELDHHIGRVLAWLDDHDLSDNTLVIYSTDHGDFAGGHGFMDKHFNMYDDILRVPLIMRWPESIPAGSHSDGFISQEIDIARTILAAAGVDAPESFVGQDVIGLLQGSTLPRSDIFSQYFGTESGMYSSRMMRDRRWKYIWNPLHLDELYDLESDPGELINLIDYPEYNDELTRLRARLVEWMESIGDRLCNTWTKIELVGAQDAFERAKTGKQPW